MATTRPFAYNPSLSPIAGTSQVGSLAIGDIAQDYNTQPGGVRWWMGPDEDLGYVIAVPNPAGDQPTNVPGVEASLQFWRSSTLDDVSFLNLCNYISREFSGSGPFNTIEEATSWLDSQGYWYSYSSDPVVTATFYIDASVPSCYSGSGTTVNNLGTTTMPAGTLTGVGYDAGIAGGVFDFDGGTDRMNFSGLNVFGTTTTISGWVYPRNEFSINTLVANAAANQSNDGFKVGWNSWQTTNLAMWFEGGNGSSGISKTSPINTVVENEWQMLTYVIDFSAQTISFYRNGAFISTASGLVANISIANLNMYVGHMNGAYNMDAYLGSLKIWDSGLDSGTILSEFNNEKARYGL
jgi:hypothetical protein